MRLRARRSAAAQRIDRPGRDAGSWDPRSLTSKGGAEPSQGDGLVDRGKTLGEASATSSSHSAPKDRRLTRSIVTGRTPDHPARLSVEIVKGLP